jgi:glycerol-3-phosphate dehydrogenase (NAD(P)+)
MERTVSILGAGALGWGVSWVLSIHRKARVKLWDIISEVITEARETRQNLKFSVPEIRLPEEVFLSEDFEETVKGSDLIILAIPSFAVREVCQKISNLPLNLPPIVMTSKGMEKETSLLPCQIGREVLGEKTNLLHLAWIGFGKEVYKKIPMDVVLASEEESFSKEFKNLFEINFLNVQTSTDLVGVELAGALKNVLAIGIGLANGEEEDPLRRARLIERAIEEMVILGKVLGAQIETFDLAGKPDLEISTTPLGRNYQLGKRIYREGIGVINELRARNITNEGFYTAFAVHRLIKDYGLRLPLLEGVYQAVSSEEHPEIVSERLRRY